MLSFRNQSVHASQTLELLDKLAACSFGISGEDADSQNVRKLATIKSSAEFEARVYEEIASALEVQDKSAEELAHNLSYLRKNFPSADVRNLETQLSSHVKSLTTKLHNSLVEEQVSEANAIVAQLERCGFGKEATQVFGTARSWSEKSPRIWCAHAKKARIMANKTMTSPQQAMNAFELAVNHSMRKFVSLYFDEPAVKKRATKMKHLIDVLPELKDASGNARENWDTVLASLSADIEADTLKLVRESPMPRWSFSMHGVDAVCVEVCAAFDSASSPPSEAIVSSLLQRISESARGGESDIFVLVGCCNSFDFVMGFLQEHSNERTRCFALLNDAKQRLAERCLAELQAQGDVFVKQVARSLTIVNPVLRSKLRMEISRLSKASHLDNSNMSGLNLDDSLSSVTTNNNNTSSMREDTLDSSISMIFEGVVPSLKSHS